MERRPPSATRTDTLLPYTTLIRSKGALARAFKTSDFNIPADIPERIEAALRQAVLDRLGLEARASMVVTGSEKIETAARRGQVKMLLHAADRSEEHTSELQSLMRISYAVFCLTKKIK